MKSREILGSSPATKEMLDLIRRVSGSKTNVLIIGESGTGKELVARMIHESGPLKGKPFVPVNCGAIPENLIESEMFGHRRGSFTGAVSEKLGMFEVATGGTLFLDEVGELPLSMQVKLLRAIQERVIRKVGGNDDIKIDIRIIAATNRDLEAAIAKGTFREDLYYRLNVLLIKTPPLRERKGDIQLLVKRFAQVFSDKQGKALFRIDPLAIQALEAYSWPGNVRELENVLERAVTLANDGILNLESLPVAIQKLARDLPGHSESPVQNEADNEPFPAPDFSNGSINLKRIIHRLERFYIDAALKAAGGSEQKAAELLSLELETFSKKREKTERFSKKEKKLSSSSG